MFFVDTSKMISPGDKADEVGGQKNDGQRPRWVKVTQCSGKLSDIEFCGGKLVNNSNVYRLHRIYYSH